MPKFICFQCNKSFTHKGTYDRHVNKKVPCNPEAKKEELIQITENIVKKEVKKEVNKVLNQDKLEKVNNSYENDIVLTNEIKEELPTVIKVDKKQALMRLKCLKKPGQVEQLSSPDNKPLKPKPKTDIKPISNIKINANVNVKTDNDSDNKSDTNSNADSDETTIIETKTVINTREDLKEKIHEIHNYLRNNGAGYGMNALKIFSLFYGLARIEKNNLFSCIDLNPECKFSEIARMVYNGENIILLTDKITEMQRMLSNSKAKRFVLYAIPKNISFNVVRYLIKEINDLLIAEERFNMQLSGKLYEYFIGRDDTAISEMGAYFTDRHLVEFIYDNVIDIQLDEKENVHSMIDPFGGSGGFTLGYVMHLQNQFPEIDWSNNVNVINHFDMNDDVIKYAGLELMCLTNQAPSVDTNIKCVNSFKYEFDKKYKYVITNPPYGGDKSSKSAAYKERVEIREEVMKRLSQLEALKDEEHTADTIISMETFHKQLKQLKQEDKAETIKANNAKVSIANSSQLIKDYANIHKLTGNDKEAVSLILMMCLVDKDGSVVGVLKGGVFFDKKYAKLRKHLIENYNVISITSVPSDQFENTTVKTSIIRFDNNGPTQKIEFYDLSIDKVEESTFDIDEKGYVVLSSRKGEIIGCSSVLKSEAIIDDIKKNSIYSLNLKDYKAIDEPVFIVPDGYKMVKLGDICTIKNGEILNQEDIHENGSYPVYGGGYDTNKCNRYNRDGINCKISKAGATEDNCILLIDGKFWLAPNAITLTYTHPKYEIYVNNWLLYNKHKIYNKICTRSAHASLNNTKINNIEIPVPINDQLLNEIVSKISTSYLAKIQATNELKTLEENIKNRVRDITENEECNEFKLGDICKMKKGIFKSSDCKQRGLYPFYTGKAHNPSGYYDKYCFDYAEYLILLKDGGSGKNKYGDHIGLGKVFYVKGKSSATPQQLALYSITKHVKYTYYYLINNKNNIMDLAEYSIALGHINMTKINNIIIKIPKNNALIAELQTEFNRVDELEQLIKVNEQAYNDACNEVFTF